jgi:dihydroflavonol-4-reductase
MKTVVTGASGHVGANLVYKLLDKNRPVHALVHEHKQSLDGVDVDIIYGDVCDLDSLCCAFNGAEVVYHLAARVSISMDDWPLLEAVNVAGTRNVIEACIVCGVRRLVYFSSIEALKQRSTDIPINESCSWVDDNSMPYARSKAYASKEVLRGIERGLDAIILSPTAIIGPNDYQLSHFGEALLSLAQGKLPALIASGYDWVDVRDVVEYAILAEEQALKGTHYLLSGHWVLLGEMASLVAEITGIPAPRVVLPLWLARIGIPVLSTLDHMTGRRPLYTNGALKALRNNSKVDCGKAKKDLGYKIRPFRETIVDTLRWFKETGRLQQPLLM